VYNYYCAVSSQPVNFEHRSHTVHVTVEENVIFRCPVTSLYETVIWIINGTNYDFVNIPEDYYIYTLDGAYGFLITEVKLWMDNTIYSCLLSSSQTKRIIGHLYVHFGRL